MNFPFKHWALAALLLPTSLALSAEGPFSVVPAGDDTYQGLSELALAGLLPGENVVAPLTRFEVAKLIAKAEERAIVLAQADDIPAPDDTDPTLAEPAPASEAPAASSPAASGEFGDELETAPAPGSGQTSSILDDSPESLQKALRTLRTLRQAYDHEVGRLKEGIKSLEKQTADLEAEQFDLRKRLKGIEQYPTVAMHGLGRAGGGWQSFSGNWPGETFLPSDHGTFAFLDMGPEGHVSKEVRWKALFRFGSSLQPNDSPVFTLRRLEIGFHPPWMSLEVCDFEESYTPLTLWNRNSLDLRYTPFQMALVDDWNKYEHFLNNEPNWPLLGARASTRFMWEEGSVLESIQLSTFAHMIRNGFDDTSADGWYFGPFLHTDWLLGAKGKVVTQDLWVGSSPLKFTLEGQGVMMDQDMGSDAIAAVYNSVDPSTWARRYVIGSIKPELRLGGEAGLAVCFGMEYAHSFFQDDQMVAARSFNDFAMLGGVSLKWADSSISLNYLNVGPYYYSPMAQARQVWPALTLTDGIFGPTGFIRTRDLYNGVPRPSNIYQYYDRTFDNTFPYGMATPNREGFGGEFDLKFLEKNAMKILGSAYYAWEITGNLVENGLGTGFVPVENPLGPAMLTRKFLYVNFGPSLDLGPLAGLPGPLEFGVNVRFENTDSGFGSLTGLSLVAGLTVEVLPVWRISVFGTLGQAQGTEVGLAGTLLARYPYLYDNSDMGQYVPFNVDGQNQSMGFSNIFPVNKNSSLYLQGGISRLELTPWAGPQGELHNVFAEVLYEIHF